MVLKVPGFKGVGAKSDTIRLWVRRKPTRLTQKQHGPVTGPVSKVHTGAERCRRASQVYQAG
ncbi:hypothetical protein B6S08_13880 [Oceanimonas doudoroffii]|uniref:Uncharacterized protein n=1 Tax=Oceanimonas doudoroffii TaxID=84158 RepID=A0A233RCN8_9GAMM|nr:hypothetical protein B6S08_13880 [Oceanimonas doudoroffii]